MKTTEQLLDLLPLFEAEELEQRLENRWVAGDCACICDCRTSKIPNTLDSPSNPSF